MRYIILSYCIALRYTLLMSRIYFASYLTQYINKEMSNTASVLNRTVSFRLKKRFPTLEHLVHAGIMREDEFR